VREAGKQGRRKIKQFSSCPVTVATRARLKTSVLCCLAEIRPFRRDSASKKFQPNVYVLYSEYLFVLLPRKFSKIESMFANFIIDSFGIPPHRTSAPSFDGNGHLPFSGSDAISPVCKQTLREGYFYSYPHGIFFFDKTERTAESKNRFSTLRRSSESPKSTFYPVRRAGFQGKYFFTSSNMPDFKKKSFSRRPTRRISRKILFHVVKHAGFQEKIFFMSSNMPDFKKKTFSRRQTRRISGKRLFHVVKRAGFQEKIFFMPSNAPDFKKKSFSCRPTRRIPKQNYKSLYKQIES
jgi:hypothetical protein